MKKFIIQTIVFGAFLFWTASLHCQTNGTNGHEKIDSIQKEAELNRLMDSTMKYINISMDKIKPTTTVTDFEKYYEAYRFFRIMFLQVCRDEWNRKKKK